MEIVDEGGAAASSADTPLVQSSANAPTVEQRKRRVTPKSSEEEVSTNNANKKQKKQQLTLGHFFSAKPKKQPQPAKKQEAVEAPPAAVAAVAGDILDTMNTKRKHELINIVVGRKKSPSNSTTRRLFENNDSPNAKEPVTPSKPKEAPSETMQQTPTNTNNASSLPEENSGSELEMESSKLAACEESAEGVIEICSEDSDTDALMNDAESGCTSPKELADSPRPDSSMDGEKKEPLAATETPTPKDPSGMESTPNEAKNDAPVLVATSSEETPSPNTAPALEGGAADTDNAKIPSASAPAPSTKKRKSCSATKSPKMPLSEEDQLARIKKLESLENELRNGLDEETWELPVPSIPDGTTDLDVCMKTIAALVEGRPEPLVALSERVQTHLSVASLTLDAIQKKILEIAKRIHHLPVADEVDTNNDSNAGAFWRWEVITTAVLPQSGIVRKVRMIRKKLAAVISALRNPNTTGARLIQAETQLQAARVTARSAWAEICAKNAEKERKLKEAAAAKAKKKQDAAEAKLKKQQETALKKQEVEAAKQRKKEQKEEEARKKATQARRKDNTLLGQRKCMMAFVAKKKTETPSKTTNNKWDVDTFRSSFLDESASSDPCPFRKLSQRALASRKRKTKRIQVPVTVTVVQGGQADNPFAAEQAYAEEQMVEVRNRYSFLKFHEDVRPAYYGTWSKRSSIVTGRTPLSEDNEYLNYDVDSEVEWEEGDDDFGEELDDDAVDEDEDDDDAAAADEDDGWLAADDDEHGNDRQALNLCFIVAPINSKEHAAIGFTMDEGKALLERHRVKVLSTENICLDVAPSVAPIAEREESDEPELSDENMKTFAKFVHNCRLGSKEKVVEEMLKVHTSVVSTRAQAYRVLDAIAEKRKHTVLGVVWQVKDDVLDSAGLQGLNESKQDDELELMKTFALYVHHRQTASKDKLVDEFREAHSIRSRAEAQRLLSSIADKLKHPVSGVYWQVKKDIQERLNLDLPSDPPPKIETTATKSPNVASQPPSAHKAAPESAKKEPAKTAASSSLLSSFLSTETKTSPAASNK